MRIISGHNDSHPMPSPHHITSLPRLAGHRNVLVDVAARSSTDHANLPFIRLVDDAPAVNCPAFAAHARLRLTVG